MIYYLYLRVMIPRKKSEIHNGKMNERNKQKEKIDIGAGMLRVFYNWLKRNFCFWAFIIDMLKNFAWNLLFVTRKEEMIFFLFVIILGNLCHICCSFSSLNKWGLTHSVDDFELSFVVVRFAIQFVTGKFLSCNVRQN